MGESLSGFYYVHVLMERISSSLYPDDHSGREKVLTTETKKIIKHNRGSNQFNLFLAMVLVQEHFFPNSITNTYSLCIEMQVNSRLVEHLAHHEESLLVFTCPKCR